MNVDDVISEGQKVVMRVTMRGTHRGELMGIAATGREVSLAVIDICRFEGSKMVEHWGVFNAGALLEQLGVSAVR